MCFVDPLREVEISRLPGLFTVIRLFPKENPDNKKIPSKFLPRPGKTILGFRNVRFTN